MLSNLDGCFTPCWQHLGVQVATKNSGYPSFERFLSLEGYQRTAKKCGGGTQLLSEA